MRKRRRTKMSESEDGDANPYHSQNLNQDRVRGIAALLKSAAMPFCVLCGCVSGCGVMRNK